MCFIVYRNEIYRCKFIFNTFRVIMNVYDEDVERNVSKAKSFLSVATNIVMFSENILRARL